MLKSIKKSWKDTSRGLRLKPFLVWFLIIGLAASVYNKAVIITALVYKLRKMSRINIVYWECFKFQFLQFIFVNVKLQIFDNFDI